MEEVTLLAVWRFSTRGAGTGSNRILTGIFCIQAGMALFVVQDGMMKALLGDFPVWMLIFSRGVVAVAVLAPLILILGPPHRLWTPLWPLHLLRGFLFVSGFSVFYAAFPLMSLAKATTIFFTAPLFITLLAALFLGEKIGIHRIGALLAGFAGVVIVVDPGSAEFGWVVLAPLYAALTYAVQQVMTRQIGDRETNTTLGLYSLAAAAVFVVPIGYGVNELFDFGPAFRHLRWEWWIPDLEETGFLAFLGLNGTVAILLLWRAYQIAPASAVTPFEYSYLIWAAMLGYVVFDEVPATNTIVGMVLIAASGVYIGFREMRQLRREASTGVAAGAATEGALNRHG